MIDYFRNSPRKNSNLQMLYQFRDTLQANLLSVPADDAAMPQTMATLRKKNQEVLDAKPFTWAAAYQAEKMLAHIRPKESLEIEIKKQISALEKVDPTAAALFTKEFKALEAGAATDTQSPPSPPAAESNSEQPKAQDEVAPQSPAAGTKPAEEASASPVPPNSPPAKAQGPVGVGGQAPKSPPSQAMPYDPPNTLALRHLLERVLNDVHWKYSQRYFNRRIIDRYSLFVFLSGSVLAVLFFGTLLGIGILNAMVPETLNWSFSGYFLAVVAGLLGASFSVFNRDRSLIQGNSIEETMLQTGLANVYLRIGIGGISAAILYFFFNAGLLNGTLLPNLEALGFTPLSPSGVTKAEIADAFKTIAAMDATQNSALKDLIASAKDSQASPELVETLTKAIQDAQPVQQGNSTRPMGIMVPNAELCKLLVWSFVAGFFEQFVPNALKRVEQSAEHNTPNDKPAKPQA